MFEWGVQIVCICQVNKQLEEQWHWTLGNMIVVEGASLDKCLTIMEENHKHNEEIASFKAKSEEIKFREKIILTPSKNFAMQAIS